MKYPISDQFLYVYGDEIIAHHGIKGQQWGKRNGPPYPLKPEMHSAAEKKQMKVKGSSYGASGPSSEKKMSFSERANEKMAQRADKELAGNRIEITKEMVDREKSKEGENLLKNKKTAAAVAVSALINPFSLITNGILVGIQAGRAGHANKKLKKYMQDREENGEYDPETGLYKKKEGQYTEKEDMALVNPGFENLNSNSKNNCMLCTTTYDLRQRGYDVTAQLDSQGYNFRDVQRWYKGAKIQDNNRRDASGKALSQKEYVKKTLDTFAKQPDGSHGNLMITFTEGGGHSLYYEVKNGKLIIKDTQANTVYNNPEKIFNLTSSNSFVRLDNCEPNYDVLKKECVR